MSVGVSLEVAKTRRGLTEDRRPRTLTPSPLPVGEGIFSDLSPRVAVRSQSSARQPWATMLNPVGVLRCARAQRIGAVVRPKENETGADHHPTTRSDVTWTARKAAFAA